MLSLKLIYRSKPSRTLSSTKLCSPTYCRVKPSTQSFPWAIWMRTALLWVGMLKMTVRKLTGMVTSPEKPNEQRGLFRVFFIKKTREKPSQNQDKKNKTNKINNLYFYANLFVDVLIFLDLRYSYISNVGARTCLPKLTFHQHSNTSSHQ